MNYDDIRNDKIAAGIISLLTQTSLVCTTRDCVHNKMSTGECGLKATVVCDGRCAEYKKRGTA